MTSGIVAGGWNLSPAEDAACRCARGQHTWLHHRRIHKRQVSSVQRNVHRRWANFWAKRCTMKIYEDERNYTGALPENIRNFAGIQAFLGKLWMHKTEDTSFGSCSCERSPSKIKPCSLDEEFVLSRHGSQRVSLTQTQIHHTLGRKENRNWKNVKHCGATNVKQSNNFMASLFGTKHPLLAKLVPVDTACSGFMTSSARYGPGSCHVMLCLLAVPKPTTLSICMFEGKTHCGKNLVEEVFVFPVAKLNTSLFCLIIVLFFPALNLWYVALFHWHDALIGCLVSGRTTWCRNVIFLRATTGFMNCKLSHFHSRQYGQRNCFLFTCMPHWAHENHVPRNKQCTIRPWHAWNVVVLATGELPIETSGPILGCDLGTPRMMFLHDAAGLSKV